MSDSPILPTSPTADTPATTPLPSTPSSSANAKSLDDVLASLEKEVNQLTAEKSAKPATPATPVWSPSAPKVVPSPTAAPVMPSAAKPVSVPPMMPMNSTSQTASSPLPTTPVAKSTFSDSVTEHPVGDTKPISNPMSAPKPAFGDKKPVNTAALIAESQHATPTPTAPASAPASNNKPTKKWKINGKLVAGLVGLIVLLVGTLVTLNLLPQNQDIRQQAAYGDQCWEKHEIECRGDSQCVWKPVGVSEPHQCAFEGANCNHQDRGCVFTQGRNRGCSGPGNCPTKLSVDGCNDSGLCTWTENAVASSCTGTWTETQYGAGSCEPGTPPATNPPTNPPATNPPATNPPATNPPAGSVNDCHYVINGGTVSVAGNCTGITFQTYLFECDGANGTQCEPGQAGYGSQLGGGQSVGSASISIGSVPCGKRRQADVTIIDRPDNHQCGPGQRGNGVACDTLPGNTANFIIQPGDANCPTTPPTTPPTASGPSCVSLIQVPGEGSGMRGFQVTPRLGSNPLNKVGLYYRQAGLTGPDGWTNIGEKFTNSAMYYFNWILPTNLAPGTYDLYAQLQDTSGAICSGSPGCTGAEGTRCKPDLAANFTTCSACRTQLVVGPPTVTPPACTRIMMTGSSAPKIGDTLTFTCAGNFANGYNFRYSSNNGATFTALADNDSGTSNPLTITVPGKYVVQCQACKDGSCTNWQAVQ